MVASILVMAIFGFGQRGQAKILGRYGGVGGCKSVESILVHVDQNTKVRGGWCKRLSGTKIHNGYQKYLRHKWSLQTASKDMRICIMTLIFLSVEYFRKDTHFL